MRANWTQAALAAALVAALSGCAVGPSQDELQADKLRAEQAQTQKSLDLRLTDATTKISAKLDTIERLERGDPAAGAKATSAAPGSKLAMAADPLQTRVRISWNGSADALLRGLTSKMGVAYTSSGVSPDLMVHVEAPDASAEQVLGIVGQQLNGQADVVYNREARALSLRGHSGE